RLLVDRDLDRLAVASIHGRRKILESCHSPREDRIDRQVALWQAHGAAQVRGDLQWCHAFTVARKSAIAPARSRTCERNRSPVLPASASASIASSGRAIAA